MSLQLPSLLSSMAMAPAPAAAPAAVPLVVDSLPLAAPKQMIILHTIDIKPADLETLKSYGKVVIYDCNVEMKMPLSSLVFSYLLLDLRKKADRVYLDSQDTSAYNVIVYISIIEKFDAFIENLGCNNIITKWPPRCHLQGDWNNLLLKQCTAGPSKCLSCFTFASNYLTSLKKTTA
jgi:hypothetical protein